MCSLIDRRIKMQKLTYLDLAKKVLQEAQKPLTHDEIWNQAVEMGLDKMLSSIGKTPWQTIQARLYVNIRDNPDSEFILASRRPTTFWLKSNKNELEILKTIDIKIIKEQTNRKFHERDLHPLLVKYLKESSFDCYAKTIMHEKSKKGQGGEDRWNYPDIVAVHFPFSDWEEKETLELAHHLNLKNYRIYSFELKVKLDFSNLKESYFQAVSNSSFANEGYLVVFEKVEGEVLDEVRRLNQSFGIGLIKLEVDSVETRILLPARSRELDFKTLDMLVNKNKDFKKFIADLNRDIQVNDKHRIIVDNYDKILDDDKIKEYAKERHLVKE